MNKKNDPSSGEVGSNYPVPITQQPPHPPVEINKEEEGQGPPPAPVRNAPVIAKQAGVGYFLWASWPIPFQ